MSTRRIILTATLALVSIPALAQSLTLDDCIRKAIDNNAEYRERLIQHERVALQRETKRNTFLPTLQASVSNNWDFGRSQNKTGVMQDRSSMSTSVSISANLTLFTGFSRLHDLRSATLNTEASLHGLEQARHDLGVQVTRYYYAYLHAKRIEEVVSAQVRRSQEQLDYTKGLVSSGKWSSDRQADAEAQLATDSYRLVEAQNTRQSAYSDLLLVMQTTERPEISTINLEESVTEATASLQPSEEVYRQAEVIRPSLLANTKQLQAAQEDIASARSGYLPQLSVGAGYSNSYYRLLGTQYSALNASFANQWKHNGRSYIGLNLSIPIFDAFRTRTSIRTAKLARIELETTRISLQTKLRREIEQATLNAQLALRKIDASRASLIATSKARELTDAKWKAGRSTANELSEASNKAFSAEVELVNAQYDFVLRSKILSFYTQASK